MQLVDGIGPYIRKMPINGILPIVPVSDGLDRGDAAPLEARCWRACSASWLEVSSAAQE